MTRSCGERAAMARFGRRFLAIAMVAVLAPIPAISQDEPPEIVIRAGGAEQRGALVWVTWSWPLGSGCVSAHGHGTGGYPADAPTVVFLRDEPAEITLGPVQPEEAKLWTSPGVPVPVSIERRRIGEEDEHWVAEFQPILPGRNELTIYIRWPSECLGRDGMWNFSLQASVVET